MKTLRTPKVTPDKPNYWSTDVPDKGEHVFRLPFPTKGWLILSEIHKTQAKSLGNMTEVGDILDTTSKVWNVLGAAIGICWRHPSLTLETKRGDYNTLSEYGEAILEELYDEEYTLEDVQGMGHQIVERLSEVVMPTKAEVVEAEDFSEEPVQTI